MTKFCQTKAGNDKVDAAKAARKSEMMGMGMGMMAQRRARDRAAKKAPEKAQEVL